MVIGDVTNENDRYQIVNVVGGYGVYAKGTEKRPELEGEWVATFNDPTVAFNFINWHACWDVKFEAALKYTIELYKDAFKDPRMADDYVPPLKTREDNAD